MFNNLCVTKYQCLAYLIHYENNTINCEILLFEDIKNIL